MTLSEMWQIFITLFQDVLSIFYNKGTILIGMAVSFIFLITKILNSLSFQKYHLTMKSLFLKIHRKLLSLKSLLFGAFSSKPSSL